MARVNDVAKYFISLSKESTPYAITPLKLQKLIYYAQGFHLKRTNRPLFNAELEAWTHGPVVRRIYEIYREHGYRTIPQEPFINEDIVGNPLLDREEIKTIDEVWDALGHLDGKTLEELTHQEDPWLNTNINDYIDINIIRDYFDSQYQY